MKKIKKNQFNISLNNSINNHRKWSNSSKYTEKRIMRPTPKIRLGSIIIATIIVCFWILNLTIRYNLYFLTLVLRKIQGILNLESLYIASSPASNLATTLILLWLFTPWVLDTFLCQYYHVNKFTKERLETRYPETTKTIHEYCKKYHRSQPNLKIIQTPIPFVITYGIPFASRIIISDGLLQCLTDEELATIYAMQLGHIINGDLPLMTLLMTLLQIPYLIYWQLASLGEEKRFHLLKRPLAWLAALFYGLYWLWKWPTLWLSRQRVYHSDRFAVELTQNPNALSRALLKIAIGISEQIEQNGYTPRILESFDLLLPLDPQQVLSLGSLPSEIPYETVLEWEYTNPYRHWLALFTSHPLIGERLYLLEKCAQFWQLEPEFNLSDRHPSLQKAELWPNLKNFYYALPLLLSSLVYALGFGIVLRCLFWAVGRISEQLHYQPLVWMYKAYPLLNAWVGWLVILLIMILICGFSKRSPHVFTCVVLLKMALDFLSTSAGGRFNWLSSRDPIFEAWVLIALSLTLIIWTNRYFPSPQKSLSLNEPDLSDLLANPETLPYQSQIVTFSGRLLGHSGLGNWLGQDLVLQTSSGLIKLHFVASGGVIGELLSLFPRPCQYVNQLVTVQGWFRRGSSPWIDVEQMTTQRGQRLQGGYQMFITLLALGCAAWGAYQILTI